VSVQHVSTTAVYVLHSSFGRHCDQDPYAKEPSIMYENDGIVPYLVACADLEAQEYSQECAKSILGAKIGLRDEYKQRFGFELASCVLA
jgi:hypothetical protein